MIESENGSLMRYADDPLSGSPVGTLTRNTSASDMNSGRNAVEFVLQTMALIVFNCTVIVGNCLVIMAVFTHSRLRPTTTNKFIVSLAVADLMVGLVVLPFSSTNQVLRYWPFGTICCRVWLAVDVWLCTASIYNLCAISLDRYLAISRPFKYHKLMSPFRAKMLIIGVWIVSFVICFPPLIGWNEKQWTAGSDSSANFSSARALPARIVVPRVVGFLPDGSGAHDASDVYTAEAIDGNPGVPGISYRGKAPICTLTSEPGYIVYSACGSFWVPMFIMVVFYYKIYKTAMSATDAFRRGFIETTALPNSNSDNLLSIRIHRGSRMSTGSGAGSVPRHSNGCISELLPQAAAAVSIGLARHSFDSQMSARSRAEAQGVDLSAAIKAEAVRRRSQMYNSRNPPLPKIVITATPSCEGDRRTSSDETAICRTNGNDDEAAAAAVPNNYGSLANDRKSSMNGEGKSDSRWHLFGGNGGDGTDRRRSVEKRGSMISQKLSKLHIITQLRNLNKEKKAAKTVGIIVGCFILCWAPFFTLYFVGAFCPGCTHSMVFQVFFWLGYWNSAVNPVIYGLCSKEFRAAFKILLRCRCMVDSGDRAKASKLQAMVQNYQLERMAPKKSIVRDQH